MNEWMNQWMNEWMNEWMKESVYSLKLYNFYEWEQWSRVNQMHGC